METRSTTSGKLEIVVVNSDVGNVGAIPNMLRRLGVKAQVSNDPGTVDKANCIIIPGVGSYDSAMRYFRQTGLKEVLDEKIARQKVPTLGICLGMQVMAEGSEEGVEKGFGWIPGRLKRLRPSDGRSRAIRVPHMGWGIVEEVSEEPLYAGMENEIRFYFDHSYYWQPEGQEFYCGVTEYGIRFAAGVKRGNLYGVQFHPEKSHRFGLKLFENFLEIASIAVYM